MADGPPRVCCFYTELHPLTRAALDRFAPQAELVHTPAGDIYAYGRELAARWTGESDLIVTEGDKEIHGGCLPSFEQCSRPWCAFGSLTSGPRPMYTNIGLTCARFAARLQRDVPARAFGGPDDPRKPLCWLCGGRGCYLRLDGRIAAALWCRAYILHDHGEIAHHHPRLKIIAG